MGLSGKGLDELGVVDRPWVKRINRWRLVVSMCKITSPWEDSFLVSSAQLVRNEVEQWQLAVMLM